MLHKRCDIMSTKHASLDNSNDNEPDSLAEIVDVQKSARVSSPSKASKRKSTFVGPVYLPTIY